MILKIFVKINKNKQAVDPSGKNRYYESDEIIISPTTENNSIVNYELFVKGIDDVVPVRGEIDLDKYGYEIFGADGTSVERVITKVNL